MKLIHGRTRSVILIGKYAIKLPYLKSWPYFVRGLLDNMFEKSYNRFPSEFLAPLLFSLPGGFLNVYPRCSVITDPKDPQLWKLFKNLYEEDNEYILNIIEVAEPSNFGYYQGRIVAIDYGHGRQYFLNKRIVEDELELF